MQQEWDDIDSIILNSKQNIVTGEDYNRRLMARLRQDSSKKNQSYISAFSLIMAGFLAIFIYTSDIQYRVIDLQIKTKSYMLSIEYNHENSSIIKYFIGE